jgi:mRNA interferase MazF
MARVELFRGDVVDVDLSGALGVEKQKTRPCVVVQNDGGNLASPMTIVVPITDAGQFKGYKQQVFVLASELGAGAKDSVIECGHIRTIDRDARIASTAAVRWHLSHLVMARVDDALRASLSL